MKFLVIKDLTPNGVDADWLAAMRSQFLSNPEKLRADYQKLVESLARLHLIETTLRKQVLHLDEPTTSLREEVDKLTPMLGTVFSTFLDGAGQFITSSATAALAGALTRWKK